MPASDIVTINITLATLGAERPGFGTPLVAGEVSVGVAAIFTARTTTVTKATFVAVLTALGFIATDAIYVACNTLFSQNPTPTSAIVGRRDTPTAQVSNVDVIGGAEDGTYSIVINGTSFDFVASGSSTALISAGLLAAINAGSEPVTAAPGAGDSIDLTSDEAGVPFTLTVATVTAPIGNLVPTTATPNIGIGEDLAAIQAENGSWYALLETSRSHGVIVTAAQAIQAFQPEKIFLAQSNDSDILVEATNTDIGSVLEGLALSRTSLWYHDDDAEFADCAMAGDALPTDPGSITWNNRQITGVTPPTLSAADIASLVSKKVNYLETIAGLNITRGGITSSGEFLDVIRGIDWFAANLSLDVLDLLVQADKIPYTDEGGATLKGVVDGRGENAINQGVFATFDSTVPVVADILANEKAVRNFPDVDFEATLQGAIHTVEINGTVSV